MTSRKLDILAGRMLDSRGMGGYSSVEVDTGLLFQVLVGGLQSTHVHAGAVRKNGREKHSSEPCAKILPQAEVWNGSCS